MQTPVAPIPVLSPDGRYWWNGTAWTPMAASSAYPSSKNKIAAGLLGIFLGGLGVHKFYLGQIGLGIVYLLFSWTGIPMIIGFIEGILYLLTSDAEWAHKHPLVSYSPPMVPSVAYGPSAQ